MSNKRKDRPFPRPDIHAIEAAVAYFDARISFASRGDRTVYKQAQRKAYEALSKSLSETLEQLRK